MYECYFTFRSNTGAQRAQHALQKEKLRCQLLRTPKSMSVNGCGYALKVRPGEAPAIRAALAVWGIEYRKIFKVYPDGRTEEERL